MYLYLLQQHIVELIFWFYKEQVFLFALLYLFGGFPFRLVIPFLSSLPGVKYIFVYTERKKQIIKWKLEIRWKPKFK